MDDDVEALKAEIARLERRVGELEGRASESSSSLEWAPSAALSEELELLLSELSDYVWSAELVGGEFRYRYYSPVVEQITGRPPAFFLEGAGAWLNIIHPDDVERLQAAAQQVVSGEVPVIEASYRIFKPDGEERWVRDRAVRVERPDGTVRINGIVRDVTDQVRAEARSRALHDQLQHSQRLESLGLLAGGIAHDFNNLLVGVLGGLDLAQASLDPDAPAREDLAQAEAAATRCAELCRQLLAYSGKGQFVVGPLSLPALLRNIDQLLELSVASNHEIRYELDDEVPLLSGDQAQLRQVVINLLTHASQTIGPREGTISLRVGRVDADADALAGAHGGIQLEPGPYVYLEVQDSGDGLDEAELDRLFDPFTASEDASVGIGEGLGLAAVLGIVRGHGGAIWTASEAGSERGICFRILFPAVDADQRERASERAASDATAQRPAPREGTVLVVDDNPAVREVSKRMLEQRGFDVVLASDGVEGVEIYEQRGPELCLVLLDMSMPRLDGRTTLAAIKALDPEAKVVMMSGYADDSLEADLSEQGRVAFVAKPFRQAGLDAVIDALLGESEGGGA